MLVLTLIKGIVVGIVIALPVGPVGVLCVRRTLFEGAAYGLVSGVGAATADACFGAIAGFGLTFARDWFIHYEDWLGAAGGIFLLALGARALFTHDIERPEPLDGERLFGAYFSTFLLTIANPITILSFAVIFAKLGAQSATGFLGISLLVGGVFLGSLLWWVGLSFGIVELRKRAGNFQMKWLNRISGTILSVSGAGLLAAALVGLARDF